MKQLILALSVVCLASFTLAPSVRAESEVKTEAKNLKNTVKRDHKKIGKQAKSEAKSAWGKFKGLAKKTKKDVTE